MLLAVSSSELTAFPKDLPQSSFCFMFLLRMHNRGVVLSHLFGARAWAFTCWLILML
jgi:hypothetical protein